jgi:uncharacterized damage-inducible protein DinB
MFPFYQDFLNCLDEHHKNIACAIEGLPQAALDWLPGEGMNSISVLIIHLTGAERYWIGDVASGDLSSRDRAAEFHTRGIPCEALQQRLADATDYAHSTLSRLTLDDLGQERVSRRDGRKFTVAWALLHTLEHTALHVGHIEITRQLWEARKH